MRTSDLPQRSPLEQRIKIALAPDDKRRVFETAARRGVTVSELTRAALVRECGEQLSASN